MRHSLCCFLFIFGLNGILIAQGGLPVYLPVQGSAFQLTVEDLDRDGLDELLYATYDGRLRCTDAANPARERWSYLFDSFPTGLLVSRRFNEGEPEIYLTDIDGRLTTLERNGRECWHWQAPLALHGVAEVKLADGTSLIATGGLESSLVLLEPRTGRVCERIRVEHFVQRLASGDLDGDGTDEIVIADHRENIAVYHQVEKVWRRRSFGPLFLGDRYRNWESPGGTFKVFSLAVGDLDGDGRAEIILGDSYFNMQAVLVLNGDGSHRWLYSRY